MLRKSYTSFSDYALHVRRLIEEYSDIIADVVVEVFEATGKEGFIRGSMTFIDGSRLSFLEYVRISAGNPVKLRYRYHYEDPEGKLVFRYDNAPHHRNIDTFPHHKHLANGRIVESREPTLKEVLEEIIALMR